MLHRGLAMIVSCLVAISATGDLYIRMTTTAVEGDQRHELITEAWFRADMAANRSVDGRSRIIRFDRRVIWDIDPDTRRYTQTTFERMAALEAESRKQQQAQLERMREMAADPKLAPADRERLERMLVAYAPKTYSFEEQGEESVVIDSVAKGDAAAQRAEIRARRYVVKVADKPFMTVWATDELGNVAEFNRLQELSSSHQPGMLDQLRKIRGVWIKWETADGLRAAVATQVSTAPLPPERFEVPAGYKPRE